jgi:hypothetical protein
MLGLSEILALTIALLFVYLVLSAITSQITESISTLFGLRSKNLADAIQMLFEPSAKRLNGYQRLNEGGSPVGKPKTKLPSHLEKIKDNLIKAFFKLLTILLPFKTNANQPQKESEFVGELKKKNQNVLSNILEENPVKAFYQHPIIQSLSKPDQRPSYIAARDFSTTLLDLLMDSSQGQARTSKEYLIELKENIKKLKNKDNKNHDLQRSLLPLIEYVELTEIAPEKRIALLNQKIDEWYTTTMERSRGWYKKRVQIIGIIVGFLVALVLNADTINIVQSLWTDTAMRQAMLQVAQEYNGPNDTDNYQKILNDLSVVKFPLGWSPLRNDGKLTDQYRSLLTPPGIISKMIGLIITALAISVGSNIWFDIFNRVINLRNTGDKPQNSPQ